MVEKRCGMRVLHIGDHGEVVSQLKQESGCSMDEFFQSWIDKMETKNILGEHSCSTIHNAATIAFMPHKQRQNISQTGDIKRERNTKTIPGT